MKLPPNTRTLLVGLALLLVARYLPPDTSLAQVQQAGVLRVCHPRALPPLVAGSPPEGQEVELVERLAAGLGVRVQYNLQAGWGQGLDPVDWGLRPESCEILVGGILYSPDTAQLFTPLVYAQSEWVLLGQGQPVGILAPFWGAELGRLEDWLEGQGLEGVWLGSTDEALKALESGQKGSVLTLSPTAHWLQDRLGPLPQQTIEALGQPWLALGVWKGRTTLKRALQQALAVPAAVR